MLCGLARLTSAVEQYIFLLLLHRQILTQNNAFTRWVKTAGYSSTRRVAPFGHISFVSFNSQYAYTASNCFLESTPKPAQLQNIELIRQAAKRQKLFSSYS